MRERQPRLLVILKTGRTGFTIQPGPLDSECASMDCRWARRCDIITGLLLTLPTDLDTQRVASPVVVLWIGARFAKRKIPCCSKTALRYALSAGDASPGVRRARITLFRDLRTDATRAVGTAYQIGARRSARLLRVPWTTLLYRSQKNPQEPSSPLRADIHGCARHRFMRRGIIVTAIVLFVLAANPSGQSSQLGMG
jgi:hypothetical protein